jgi:hypothetical protein
MITTEQALTFIQALSDGNHACTSLLEAIQNNPLISDVCKTQEINILLIGLCYAIQHNVSKNISTIEVTTLLYYGVQVLNNKLSLDRNALLQKLTAEQTQTILHSLNASITFETTYTTSFYLQHLLRDHTSRHMRESRPVLEDTFYQAFNNLRLLKSPTAQQQNFIHAIEHVMDVTLSHFDLKKVGFNFDDCKIVAEKIKVLSNQAAQGLEQQDIDNFVQSVKPYLHCDRMQAAFIGLIGAALGMIAGCVLGGGIPGVLIGAAVGMTLFGGASVYRQTQQHPLMQVAHTAKASL